MLALAGTGVRRKTYLVDGVDDLAEVLWARKQA